MAWNGKSWKTDAHCTVKQHWHKLDQSNQDSKSYSVTVLSYEISIISEFGPTHHESATRKQTLGNRRKTYYYLLIPFIRIVVINFNQRGMGDWQEEQNNTILVKVDNRWCNLGGLNSLLYAQIIIAAYCTVVLGPVWIGDRCWVGLSLGIALLVDSKL